MNKFYVIGFGHRAQNGKDTSAELMCKHLKDTNTCYILHFSDDLYRQVYNHPRKHPLIIREENTFIFNDMDENGDIVDIRIFEADYVPEFAQLFDDRGITEYWGMDSKDATMLQLWGTNFRRRFYGEDYWIKIVNKKIQDIIRSGQYKNGNVYFFIPDVRFPNEVAYLHRCVLGYYILTIRLNEDGSQYIDTSRDPNHSSECSLDGVPGDEELIAHTVPELELYILLLIDKIKNNLLSRNI
jgi:hypothetical protein